MKRQKFPPASLRNLLDNALDRCDAEQRLSHDPLGIVHRYQDPADREVVALIAASLAYGRVDLIRRAVDEVLHPLGAHPAQRLKDLTTDELSRQWPDFRYRMTGRDDLIDLLVAIHRTLRAEGSLQALYQGCSDGDRPIESPKAHLSVISQWIQTLRHRRLRPTLERGLKYLLVDPTDGSAAKRMHLFFRWMVRGPDELDLGLWHTPAPSALIMPLDTHTSRLVRYLGLSQRKSTDLKAALTVTHGLARLAPDDPLRYDFALCHLGISEQCIHQYSPPRCSQCPIEPACVLAQIHG